MTSKASPCKNPKSQTKGTCSGPEHDHVGHVPAYEDHGEGVHLQVGHGHV